MATPPRTVGRQRRALNRQVQTPSEGRIRQRAIAVNRVVSGFPANGGPPTVVCTGAAACTDVGPGEVAACAARRAPGDGPGARPPPQWKAGWCGHMRGGLADVTASATTTKKMWQTLLGGLHEIWITGCGGAGNTRLVSRVRRCHADSPFRTRLQWRAEVSDDRCLDCSRAARSFDHR